MRLTILFGFLAFAIACGGDDATGPSNTVEPGPPQFEAVGDYYLWAVGDTVVAHDAISTAGYHGFYIDECIGVYDLLVGPGGRLTLYPDSTYRLRYTEEVDILSHEPVRYLAPDTLVDLSGEWAATGTTYDTLSLTDYWRHMVDWTGPWWLRYTSPMYRLDILRGVLRGEFHRRTTTTGGVLITPLYIDLYFDQPFAWDSTWSLERDAYLPIHNLFKLTFLRS